MSSLLYRQLCKVGALPSNHIRKIKELVPAEPIEPTGYRLSSMTPGYGIYIWDMLIADPGQPLEQQTQWRTARKLGGYWYVFHGVLGKVGWVRPDLVTGQHPNPAPQRDGALYWIDLDVVMSQIHSYPHCRLPAWREGFSKSHT